jgi:hypothetical protein
MNYIRNGLCRLRRRSGGYTESTNIIRHMQNIYLPTKSVKDVQLIPTTRYTRTLVLFAGFIGQNFRIEADQDIPIAATVNAKMLQDLQ